VNGLSFLRIDLRMSPTSIVQKPCNYCNVLRDDLSACGYAQVDGMSYLLARLLEYRLQPSRAQASGDYVEHWRMNAI